MAKSTLQSATPTGRKGVGQSQITSFFQRGSGFVFTYGSPKRKRSSSSEENPSDAEIRASKKQKTSTNRSPLKEIPNAATSSRLEVQLRRRLYDTPERTRLHLEENKQRVFVEIPTQPPPCLALSLQDDRDELSESESLDGTKIRLGGPIPNSEDDEVPVRPKTWSKQQLQKRSRPSSSHKSGHNGQNQRVENRLTPDLRASRVDSPLPASSGRTRGKQVSYAKIYAALGSDTEDDAGPAKSRHRRAESDSEDQYQTDNNSDSPSEPALDTEEDELGSNDEDAQDVGSSEEGDSLIENAFTKLTKLKQQPAPKKKVTNNQTAANERRGLDLNLPPLSTIPDIFEDITLKALDLGLRQVLEMFGDRPLRVGTMCSGTESPLLALRLVSSCLKKLGEAGLEVDHKFSAEIEAFKQAYIERNFHPPLLFRDVREFAAKDGCPPTGTTAYGSRFPVPCDIDLLIAGSSCVDFSNLNNNPNAKGESNDTFLAIIAYVEYARPPMVILENVIKDEAWKRFQKEFEKIGYSMHIEKVDSKEYYLPHTRQRKYMLCIDNKLFGASAVSYVKQWGKLMQEFRRRASAPITSFLLASDDPRYLRMALGTVAKELILKNWEACRRRHENARAEKNLGPKRPYTTLLPDHSDRRFLQNRPQRDQEVLDIVYLRHAIDNIDSLYKTRPVDLSQNVDRVDRANWGITGCLTPSGMPFVTDQCRRMTGHEALRLQGIDIDGVTFTSETDANLRDLAGNAMTSTVVGPAILSALIAVARHKSFKSYVHETVDKGIPAQVARRARLCGTDQLSQGDTMTNRGAPDWLKMLEDAQKSRRYCVCEGRTELATHPILVCKECQHSACQRCSGNPKHDYQKGLVPRASRMPPSDFQRIWRHRIPVRLRLDHLPDFSMLIGEAINSDIKSHFLEILSNAGDENFVFQEMLRTRRWEVHFRSPKHRLELLLGPKPIWLLFANPDPKLPANSKLRRLLESPIGRRRFENGDVDPFSLEGRWEWRIPFQQTSKMQILRSEEQVVSWRCRLGLGDFQNETVPKQIDITVSEKLDTVFGGVAGRYELRQDCGTACESLYKKIDGDGLFFFLDPNPIGDIAHDKFVFAKDPERLEAGEHRDTIAHINPEWRPWLNQAPTTKAVYEGYWAPCGSNTTLAPINNSITQLVPNVMFDELCGIQGCHDATAILTVKARVTPEVAMKWSSVEAIDPNDKLFFKSLGWLFTGSPGLDSLQNWRPLSTAIAIPCTSCSPNPPTIKWSLSGNKAIMLEDHLAAALYEREIKHRTSGFEIHPSAGHEHLQVQIAISLCSLAHQATSRLGLKTVDKLEWNLDTAYFESTMAHFPPLRLRDNRDESQHPRLTKFKLPLRADQLRSLTWMQRQEQGVPFRLEEIEEALLPALGWKAEVKASSTVCVQGGILADEPSYGKTITSLALINEEFVARSPKDILQEFKQPHTGLINSAATLIVTPSHLTDQWLEELGRFCGGFGIKEVLVIRNIAKLKVVTVKQLCQAKVVIVPWTLLINEAYAAQLAIFAAYPQVSSIRGREFKSWQEHAIPELATHVHMLQKDGIRAFRAAMIARLEARMDDQDFVGTVPSRRLKGAKYTAADKQGKKSKAASKPDGFIAGKDKDDNWKSLQFPVLHLFRWNRIIVDEFSYLLSKEDGNLGYRDYSPAFASVIGLQAEKRWVLSGTPPLRDFLDVKRIGLFLNVSLGIDSFSPEAINADNFRNLKDQLSAVEKFRSYQERHSHCWHQRRHSLAQQFLDKFARQNAAEVNNIDCFQSIDAIRLGFDESILHEELYNHLTLNEMDTSQKAEHNHGDEGSRINSLLNVSAEHALLRSCAAVEVLDARGRISKRQKELKDYETKLANAIAVVEAMKRKCKENDVVQYQQWRSQSLGDAESDAVLQDLLKSSRTLSKSMAHEKSFRKQLDAAQSAGRSYTAQLRSLRRYQNIHELRHDSNLCDSPCCAGRQVPTDSLRTLITCGHTICKTCLKAKDGLTGCPVSGCLAEVLDQHIRSAQYFGKELQRGNANRSFGAKLDAIVKLIKSLPATDQVLLFVQSPDLMEDVEACFDNCSISWLSLGGNNADNLRAINDFQHSTGGTSKKVLILSLAGEQASGLNLTNANHIIFLSPLLASSQYDYEATMKQAIRRVRRTGQKKQVFIRRFVALSTIDVDILERRERLLTEPIWSEGHPNRKSLPEPARETKGIPEPSKVVRDKNGNFTLVPLSQLGFEFAQGEDFSSQFPFQDIEEDDGDGLGGKVEG
jgi:site-specific DNA-cytosine methylase